MVPISLYGQWHPHAQAASTLVFTVDACHANMVKCLAQDSGRCASLYQHPQLRTAVCSELSSVLHLCWQTQSTVVLRSICLERVGTSDAAHAEAASTQAATLLL